MLDTSGYPLIYISWSRAIMYTMSRRCHVILFPLFPRGEVYAILTHLMCFWVCVKIYLYSVLFLAVIMTAMVVELELVRLIVVFLFVKWGVWVSI